MSDSVTNVEIEDVLSSIRRLVSDEGRDKPRKRPQIAAQAENRLVLTPALRIAERDEQGAPEKDAPGGGGDTPAAEDQAETPFELPEAMSEPAAVPGAAADSSGQAPAAEHVPEAPALLDAAWIEQEAEIKPFVLDGPTFEVAATEPVEDRPEVEAEVEAEGETGAGIGPAPLTEPGSDRADVGESDTPEAEGPQSEDTNGVLASEGDDPGGETEVGDRIDTTLPFLQAEAEQPAGAPAEDAPWADPGATLHDAAARAAELDLSEVPQAETGDESLGPEGERLQRAAILSAKIQALEAAIAETPDQWEPDGPGGDDYAGTEVEGLAWRDGSGSAEGDTGSADHTSEALAPGDAADAPEPATVEYAERPGPDANANIEAFVTGRVMAGPSAPDPAVAAEDGDEPEQEPAPQADADVPDAPEDSVETERTEAAEDTLARSEIADFSVEEAAESAPDAAEPAETVLDEEALRALVAQIVRQELQGTLGERITRNVRKLVRREIHRAMTSQDLD